MFKSVLVANRGEIACRVFRTARRMGLRTIAVYSEADAQALHVREADEAVLIGPAAAPASYLEPAKVAAAARAPGGGRPHPGSGFPCPNADVSQAGGGPRAGRGRAQTECGSPGKRHPPGSAPAR